MRLSESVPSRPVTFTQPAAHLYGGRGYLHAEHKPVKIEARVVVESGFARYLHRPARARIWLLIPLEQRGCKLRVTPGAGGGGGAGRGAGGAFRIE